MNDFNVAGSGDSNYSDNDSVFAYQVGLGAGYAVTEKVTIDVKYRYFATEDPGFEATELGVTSYNFLFGVRLIFKASVFANKKRGNTKHQSKDIMPLYFLF
jgi:opacity protein-like surface antigen